MGVAVYLVKKVYKCSLCDNQSYYRITSGDCEVSTCADDECYVKGMKLIDEEDTRYAKD